MQARLQEQIDDFLSKLSTREFAANCTATQLVQAVSFPLAVAVLGQTSGWVSGDKAGAWMLRIFSILFRGARTNTPGLLGVVENRYRESDHLGTFNDVVGDGTLWMTLVAALGNTKWVGVNIFLDKALALRDVYKSRQLLVGADVTRLGPLLAKLKIDNARAYVTQTAPLVSGILEALEEKFRPIWENKMHEQTSDQIKHQLGDFLWRPMVGWATCLQDSVADTSGGTMDVRLRGNFTKIRNGGFYVNVTRLSADDHSIVELLLLIQAQIDGQMSGR